MSDDGSFSGFVRYFFAEYPGLSIAISAVLIWLFGRPDFWRRVVHGYDDDAPAPVQDHVAEADFYLAYEQYDEAAQALRKSIASEPPTADLMYKLLEIYAAARKSEEFLASAKYYKRTFGRHGHWDDICELGRQLLPEERLFR